MKLVNSLNSFQSSVTFLYPLKTSENLWFSDVFRCTEVTLGEYGLSQMTSKLHAKNLNVSISSSRKTLWKSGQTEKRTEVISQDLHFLGPINIKYITLHKKMKFSIKDKIPRKLWISSHLLKKSLMKNFIFVQRKTRKVKSNYLPYKNFYVLTLLFSVISSSSSSSSLFLFPFQRLTMPTTISYMPIFSNLSYHILLLNS